jgi:UbiD family decarboxylase
MAAAARSSEGASSGWTDLRSWINRVEEAGHLRTVRGVDWDVELGALTELNARGKKRTILFDEIKGYPKGFRVLVGSLLDASRVGISLGLSKTITDTDLVLAFRDRLKPENVSKDASKFPPKYVDSAPVMENVMKDDQVDILKFPAPKWHEFDGGRYIGTADAVITKDPNSDWINVGTYRLMVHGKKELGILTNTGKHGRAHIGEYFKRGESCPVAISIGHHPMLFAVAGLEVPHGVSEYNYAGALIRDNWRVIKGPVTGLPIPADSEIAIEGYVTQEMRDEGQFGEFMGYYAGGVSKKPVIQVKAIYYRNSPIMLGTAPGRPPYDYSYFRCPLRSAMIWDVLDQAGIPGVKGVWCHEAGYSRAFIVVSIKQSYEGQATQAGFIAANCRPGAYAGRYVVVVDDDIDPKNLYDVIWAISSRSDPATTIEIFRKAWDSPLDPMQPPGLMLEEYSNSRAIIIACKPMSKILRNTFPTVAESSPEMQKKIEQKWKEFLES